MRRRRKVLLVTLAALVIACAAAAVLYLRSGHFQAWAREALRARLADTTGLDCRIDRFRFDVFRGSFEVGGLDLRAPAGTTRPLELAIDEIRGSFRFVSLLRLAVDLRELEIVRPRVVLRLARDESGIDPQKVLAALRQSLALAAKHVAIRDGILDLDHRRVPLQIALDDVVCDVVYRREPPSYRVHLAYRNGHTVVAGRELVYDLDTRVTLAERGIDFESVELRREHSTVRGDGWMREWHAPVLLLHTDARISAEDLALFVPELADARGELDVASNVKLESGGLRVIGKIGSGRGSYRGAAISELHGGFEVEHGVIRFDDVRGRVGAGRFDAEGSIHLVGPEEARNRFRLNVERIEVREAAGVARLSGLDLANSVDARLELSWRRGVSDLEFAGSATLAPAPAGTSPTDPRFTPIAGSAEFSYARGGWNLSRADLRSTATTILASGHSATAFHVQLHTQRLGEPLGLVRGFSPRLARVLDDHPDLLAAAGSFDLDGDVAIESADRMAYQGELRISAGRYGEYVLDGLTATAAWNGSRLELHSLDARRRAERAVGELTLVVGESTSSIEALDFDGSVSGVSVASLRDFGLDPGIEVEGTVGGRGRTALHDGVWSAKGALRLENGSLSGYPFDSLSGEVELDAERLRIRNGEATRGPARAAVDGEVVLEGRALALTVTLASLPLVELVRPEGKELDGRLSGSARIRGTASQPEAAGTFELAGLRYESWQLGQGSGTFEVKNRIATGTGTIRSELGSVKLHARISTEGDLPGRAEVEFRDWNLQRVASGSVPAYLKELSTALEGSLVLEGPFKDLARLTGRGEMDGARFKVHDFELRNSGKIRFTLAARKVRLEAFKLVGDGTELTLGGDAPIDPQETFSLQLQGKLNLKFLEHLENKLKVAGTAAVDVRASGALGNPQVVGIAALNNARFDYGELPFHLSGMRGNIVFSSNLVRLERVEGSAAAGSVQISGTLEHKNAELRSMNLQISAQRARVSYPKDVRSTVDAELNLRGPAEALVLTGDLDVVRAEYVRDFNLLEQLAARTSAASTPGVSDPRLAGIALNVSIHSDEGIFIDNELTKLRGRMRLTLRGSPAYPSLTGRIEASEGSIFFRGNKFEIIHASADFVDRNRINPAVDIRAESDVKSYRLLLDVSGNLDNLRFNVSSDPPLSTVDIVSLLTTGKSYERRDDTSRRQAEITGLSAASILSESLTGVIGKRVQRLFGFESFRVDPFLAGSANDPTARVTISERLSKDLTVTFSRNLSRSEEQIVIVEYDVNHNLSVIATRDEDGKFGLDFRFRKRFR